MHIAKLLLVAAAIGAPGCDPGTSDRWLLEELRVIGVRAEPAEAQPGTDVALESLVVDPLGDGQREVQVAWAVCTPDANLGQASCAEPGRTVPLGIGTGATLSIPSDALDGLSAEAALFGIDFYVVVAASAPDVPELAAEDAEVAFKRIRVSTDPVPNVNPELAWFGPASDPVDGHKTLLQAAATIESAEEFQGPLGLDVEELRFSWYTTAGALDRGVTLGDPLASELEWEATDGATLYVVLRDGRGGLNWAIHEVP